MIVLRWGATKMKPVLVLIAFRDEPCAPEHQCDGGNGGDRVCDKRVGHAARSFAFCAAASANTSSVAKPFDEKAIQ